MCSSFYFFSPDLVTCLLHLRFFSCSCCQQLFHSFILFPFWDIFILSSPRRWHLQLCLCLYWSITFVKWSIAEWIDQILLYCTGLMWQGFGSRGSSGVASVRKHQELLSGWTVSAGSRTGFFILCHILRCLEQRLSHLKVPGEN